LDDPLLQTEPEATLGESEVWGNCECRSKAKASGSLAALWVLGRFGRQVGNLNLTPLEHGASEERPAH